MLSQIKRYAYCRSNSEWHYALLDPGSSNSFCTDRLARNLGIKGKQEVYRLNTLNTCSSKRSEIVQFSVEGSTGKKERSDKDGGVRRRSKKEATKMVE